MQTRAIGKYHLIKQHKINHFQYTIWALSTRSILQNNQSFDGMPQIKTDIDDMLIWSQKDEDHDQ